MCSRRKEKSWPVVVIPDGGGGFLIRCYAGRTDVFRALRGRADDDVLYIHVDGMRIEVSFHESPASARSALDREIAAGRFATMPSEGHA